MSTPVGMVFEGEVWIADDNGLSCICGTDYDDRTYTHFGYSPEIAPEVAKLKCGDWVSLVCEYHSHMPQCDYTEYSVIDILACSNPDVNSKIHRSLFNRPGVVCRVV